MKLVACCLGLLSLPAFGGAEKLPEAPVGVYVQYQHPVSEPLAAAFEDAVRAILAPLGFDVRWRGAGSPRGEVWADLAMVRVCGTCGLDVGWYGAYREGALGWTHVSDGVVQSNIEIDCDRIGALLRTQIPADHPGNHQRIFARAMARVLTHELYHVFARTGEHEPSGAGKPEFTVYDLLSDHFQFHPDQARTLRNISREGVRRFARAWK